MTDAAGDPLAGLRDIHLPAAVPAWPPGWGWWALLALALLLLALGLAAWRRHRARAWQREALALLASPATAALADADWAAQQLQVLRRALITLDGRERAAGLTGDALHGFLRARGMDAEDIAVLHALERAAFAGVPLADRAACSRRLQAWLRRQVPAAGARDA